MSQPLTHLKTIELFLVRRGGVWLDFHTSRILESQPRPHKGTLSSFPQSHPPHVQQLISKIRGVESLPETRP